MSSSATKIVDSFSRPVISTHRLLGRSSNTAHRVASGSVWTPANVHRIGPECTAAVERLATKDIGYLFAYAEVRKLLTLSFLSLGLFDGEDLIAAACFADHPNMPPMPTGEWYNWLSMQYGINDADVRNTVWIHYLVWDRRFNLLFLKPLLQAFFETHESVMRAMMMVPPGIRYLEFLEENVSVRKVPVGHPNYLKVFTIVIIPRTRFSCNYKVRRAVEEDNDDVVDIIPKSVREHYGDYYISELLTLHPESKREIIVAEHRAQVVGVLILNSTVNYDIINEEFELIPYHGMKKPDQENDLEGLFDTTSHYKVPPLNIEEETLTVSSLVMSAVPLVEENATSNENNSDSDSAEQKAGSDKSDEEIILLNISSESIFEDYEEDHDEDEESIGSIESLYSAAILNEDYNKRVGYGDASSQGSSMRLSRRNYETEAIPTFTGEPNAFSLEICAAHPDHINCLYELFRAMFECFPERDYCIASMPPSVSNNYITKHFGRVVPRVQSTFPHELYILHKNTVCGNLTVRQGRSADKYAVGELVSTMSKGATVLEQFTSSVDVPNSPYISFLLLSEVQIAGVAIVTEESESEFLELHFHVERWMLVDQHKLGMHGCLENLVVSPIFQRLQRWFLRELIRQTNFTALYFRFKPNEMDRQHRTQPLLNVLGCLAPAKPKIMQKYDPDIIREYGVPRVVTRKFPPFALYLCTPRLTSIPKVEINKRIVVVGTGDTSMAFLDSLLFPNKTPRSLVIYTNVTVLSPHGISTKKSTNNIRELMFVHNGHLSKRYFECISLRTYVHVVTGAMSAIDRQEKQVCVNNDTYLPYDILVLLCGEQFQKPQRKIPTESGKPEYPNNVFIINTEADATNAFQTLKSLMHYQAKNTTANMVVYGHHLEACCCLTALLEIGVPGCRLVFIDPAPEADSLTTPDRHDHLINFFNNKDVEKAVFDEFQKLGITVYHDFNFVDWKFDADFNVVTSATFQSKYKILEQDIAVLFFYHAKAVSVKTFQAITRCGLVFDGKLVIDQNNRTNDPYIYAAGTLTKYSRKCHMDHLMHKYMNREEVGTLLGQQIRKKLLPEELQEDDDTGEVLKKPLVEYCTLPGGLRYLSVSKPGRPVPLDMAMNREDYGKVLVTGHCKRLDSQGYFRLHLNKFNAVETITCLAKFELDIQNIISLYGKHERLLNNLGLRFEMVMVTDLYEYFKEPWCCAIYQHDFPDFLRECSDIFAGLTTENGLKLCEEIAKKFEENQWRELNRYQLDEVEDIVKDTRYFTTLEEKLLLFLQNNFVYLPMYAHPMLIRTIMQEIRNSPLFTKK